MDLDLDGVPADRRFDTPDFVDEALAVDPLALSTYDYPLDAGRIAQHPSPRRGGSRLLVVDRAGGALDVRPFDAITELVGAGDLVVLNDARVRAARLVGRTATGGRIELTIVDRLQSGRWRALARVGRELRAGETLDLEDGRLAMTVVARDDGSWLLEGPLDWDEIERHGRAPLPPYIHRDADDPHRAADLDRYQTVYARAGAAIAAPTAGLHLTAEHLAAFEQRGAHVARVTLEVGLGTFAPVKCERIDRHAMHAERYAIDEAAAAAIEAARREARRIVAVGTTSCRALETLAREQTPPYHAVSGETRLFIHPPDRPRLVGAMLTNFHTPRSTLFMLVCAMAGRELMLAAYDRAQREGFAFHSYGDAMFIR